MSKGIIFKYEFKRLILSKEYLLLLIAALAYSVSLLRGMVMFGTGFTAPFSQWTFCTYISSVSPILFILLLALCARQFTASERGAMAIIAAAPMPVSVFRSIRYAAIAGAFLIAAVLSAGICFAFFWLVFDYTAFSALLWSGVLLLVPPALLLCGIAMLLGNRKNVFIYVLLAAVLVVGVFKISLPACVDIIGSSVIPPFSSAFITGRIAFVIAGIACIILSLKLPHKRNFPKGKDAKP